MGSNGGKWGDMGANVSATALQLVPGTPGHEPIMPIIQLTIAGGIIPYQGLIVVSIWPNC